MIPAVREAGLPSMSVEAVGKVRCLEEAAGRCPQVAVETDHLFHAGMYARTIHVPAGMVLTGALIRVPTIVIVSGDCTAYVGEEAIDLVGYHVLAGGAGRKQVFLTRADTDITMIFPTSAGSVEDAEAEFTDETGLLMSRRHQDLNRVRITEN